MTLNIRAAVFRFHVFVIRSFDVSRCFRDGHVVVRFESYVVPQVTVSRAAIHRKRIIITVQRYRYTRCLY